MSVATLFMHQGPADYLAYALIQARQSDLQGRIIVLTDSPLPAGFDFVERISPKDFSASAIEFAKRYWHFSINQLPFELMCMQRWFVIREVMQRLGIVTLIHHDSDVLVFCEADEIAKAYAGADAGIIAGHSMNSAVLYGTKFLDVLCGEMESFYFNKSTAVTEAVWSLVREYKAPGPHFNICDMTFIQAVHTYDGSVKFVDLARVKDGAVCDHNINSPSGEFVMRDGIKAISWNAGKPYGTLSASGAAVRFRSLHFQGDAKPSMAVFYGAGRQSSEHASGPGAA